MPDISYEALAGAALVIVLAVGYQYLPKSDSTASTSSSGGKNKKKYKKKVKGTKAESAEEDGESGQGSSLETDRNGKKKGKGKSAEGNKASISVPPPIKPESKSTSTSTPSFAEVAAEESDQGAVKVVIEKPKTLAQKIAPKNRKTKVDDMLAPEDRPAEHARVMKVVSSGAASAKQPVPAPTKPEPAAAAANNADSSSSSSEKIAKYEDDYQDDENTSGTGTVEDDGWDVVPSKKKKPITISGSSTPAASFTPTPGADTKIQRKNAKKAEAKKAIKDAEEEDRLKRLAQHKKGLEKERINEIYKSNKPGGGASGRTNGGAFASLDTNGKLIWD